MEPKFVWLVFDYFDLLQVFETEEAANEFVNEKFREKRKHRASVYEMRVWPDYESFLKYDGTY